MPISFIYSLFHTFFFSYIIIFCFTASSVGKILYVGLSMVCVCARVCAHARARVCLCVLMLVCLVIVHACLFIFLFWGRVLLLCKCFCITSLQEHTCASGAVNMALFCSDFMCHMYILIYASLCFAPCVSFFSFFFRLSLLVSLSMI